MADAILEVEALSKDFGAVRALHEVTLSVREGQSFGLIGPNGSGKTTLFNCVTGFHRPSSGSTRWRGEEVTGRKPQALAAQGLVRTFQHVMTFPSETALRNVATGRESASRRGSSPLPGLPVEPDEILGYCGLADAAPIEAGNLSYGKARILGIAVALAAQPRLLMLDEPASGLNDAESAELRRLLADLNERGLALFVIDHDMSFLLPLVERVAVLDAGTKLTEGVPDHIRTDPAVVAAYLGEGFEQRRSRVVARTEAASAAADPRGKGLSLDDAHAGYGATDVLHGVSIKVAHGESVAVLGANGAGKTTLIRTVSGVLTLTGGRLRYGLVEVEATSRRESPDRGPLGRSLQRARRLLPDRERSPQRRLYEEGVVHVPEGRHIFTGMTVCDNLLVAARRDAPGGAVAGDLLAWVLEIFPALSQKVHLPGGSLSGGQQQMLAIGRGLMAQPELLCLDEPSLGLAPALMETLTDRIAALQASSRMSLLIVEQSAPMALELCDRVYVMQSGTIVHESPSAELSVDALTSGYFGGPPPSAEGVP